MTASLDAGQFDATHLKDVSPSIEARDQEEPALQTVRQPNWRSLLASAFVVCVLNFAAPARGTQATPDFPQFRGPDGQGHATASGLPERWSSSQNIHWRTSLPGSGWSSPVVGSGRVWLTAADARDTSLHIIGLDAETGKQLHDVTVFRHAAFGKIHPKNTHASPTLVLDADRLFAHFGAHGTACVTTDGTVTWTTELPYYHHHGPAASPVLFDDTLILTCDGFTEPFYDRTVREGVSDHQFLVGLDAATGQVRWRTPRQGRHSYATPLVIQVAGTAQVVSPGGDGVAAYNPKTGTEIWKCRYTGYSVVPRPVSGHGLVFVCTGYDKASLLAIRTGGEGDITDTHIAWRVSDGVPFNPSPILVGNELYLVSDNGVLQCLDARTGKRHWRARLGGNFSASPVFADGRLFFQTETGSTHVVVPGLTFNRVAVNRIRGRTLASPAFVDRSIYLRTDRALFCIEAETASDQVP